MIDKYFEMSMMNNLLNQGGANQGAATAAGTTTPNAQQQQAPQSQQQQAQKDLQNLAYWEMAVGDAQPSTGTGASSTPVVNEIVVETSPQ